MATFFWIAKGSPSGVIDLDGPFNTEIGRNDIFIKNNDFWAASGIEAIPFETEGRKLDEARSIAKELIEQSAAPDTTTSPSQPSNLTPEIQTNTKEPISISSTRSSQPQGIVDVAREESDKAHGANPSTFGGDNDIFGIDNISDAIDKEIDAADAFESEVVAPESF